jgi:cytochrome P450 family 142 subfamily A polypeptide 1
MEGPLYRPVRRALRSSQNAAVKPDINLASGDFWGTNPHDALTWIREHDPVYWDEQGQVWGISRYDDVKAVSKHPELFSSAGGIRPESGPQAMMIDMDDPAHWQRRKLVNKGFTPQRVRDLEARIRSVANRLIDGVCQQGQCDFVWDVAAWLPLVMIADALGVAPEDHPRLLQWSDDLMRGLGQTDGERATRMMDAFVAYAEYITGVIDDRRSRPAEDIISVLVHAEIDGDRLDRNALIHETLLLLIGGDETTRHVITGGAYQLLRHPEQWNDLRSDLSLVPTAVEEMLRWVTPIKNMARTATQDLEFRDRHITKGQKLLLLYPSANRDADQFPDPFRFDSRRTPNEHVAFGFGAHFCLGNALARLELKVLFEQLLVRLPDLHLVDRSEPAYRPASFVSGYESMKVAFTPTSKAS